ncbi:unnamed protein product [Didymodactylos carnosus]|uniref:Ig-like domain-containing protein n=1 Tax=Didymodactylos carnosus TaxID=1234261 RepID=A0A813VMW7_9BILA|nr:unnamed protein product [Didymodactylos carnosus]CAF0848142.1 unnamed protein product [Didymodactylos carnosus]CAF3561741.1 unnamed protein product [Didymodactylos carnosus]CAF3635791.1 unnamed protein product [Didymodactylos carnosus]
MNHCSIVYSFSYFLLTFIFFLIHRTYAVPPSLKLTISPDSKYIERDTEISILCELRDPTDSDDKPVLYYVDPRTQKRTPVTRALLNGKVDNKQDIPDLFQNVENRARYRYEGKNHIKITKAQVIDSAVYECECPDCEAPPKKDHKEFFITKYVEPQLSVTPDPLIEGNQAIFRCQVDEFYPYTGFEVLIHNHKHADKAEVVNSPKHVFEQNLKWNASLPVQADWHDHYFECIVKEGEVSKVGKKIKLNVLFNPRFVTCNDKQHIDLKKNEETNVEPQIDCTYSGNPKPIIEWQKASSEKLVDTNNKDGITIVEEALPFGVYKSIVKFNRQKLDELQSVTTDGDKSYFQKLIADGFVVKLNSNLTRIITIVATEKEAASSKQMESNASLLSRYNWLCLIGSSLLLLFKLFF